MDTKELAQGLVIARTALEALEVKSVELRDKIALDLKEKDEEIQRLQEERHEAYLGHELAPEARYVLERIEVTDRLVKELKERLESEWTLTKKTVDVEGGSVTCRTNKGVKVYDGKVAAKALLEKDMWGFVSTFKVKVASVRPLLDDITIDGLEPDDSYTVSVKLGG